MTVFEKIKLQEAYQKVLNEASAAWGNGALKNSNITQQPKPIDYRITEPTTTEYSSETPEYFKAIASKPDTPATDAERYLPSSKDMPKAPLPPSPPSFWQRLKNAKGGAMGDIVNAGLRTMANGSSLVTVPYKPGTNELKSSEELQREQKNSAIAGAGAAGVVAGAHYPVVGGVAMSLADGVANWWDKYNKDKSSANLEHDITKAKVEAERTGKSVEEILKRDGIINQAARVQVEKLTGIPYETVTNMASNINVAQAYDMAKHRISDELAKQPLQQTDRDFIDSPVMRSMVNNVGHNFPLTGPFVDAYNNYHSLKRQNPDSSFLSNIGKATVKSLPVVRHLVEQPRLKPNTPPSASISNDDLNAIEID